MPKQSNGSEKKDLALTGLAFAISAAILFVLAKPIISYVALALSGLAFFGVVLFNSIGRKIHASGVAIRQSIQRAVSYIILTVIYFGFVSVLGLILSLFGMDKLRKNFSKYKALKSMFDEAPATDLDNFRRQS